MPNKITENEKFYIDPDGAPQAFIGIEEIAREYILTYQNDAAISLLGNHIGNGFLIFLNDLLGERSIDTYNKLVEEGLIRGIQCYYRDKFLQFNGKYRSDNKFQMTFSDISSTYFQLDKKNIENNVSKILSNHTYLEERLKLVLNEIASFSPWRDLVDFDESSFFIKDYKGNFVQNIQGKKKITLEEICSDEEIQEFLSNKFTLTNSNVLITRNEDNFAYIVPLLDYSEIFGLLKLQFTPRYKPEREKQEEDKEFLTEIAKNLSLGILSDRTAYYDPLTKLPKRNLLERYLLKEISAHSRRNKKFYFLGLDLDNFKPINDTFGHGVGDYVLAEIGQRIIQSIREYDIIARVGGDEFAGFILSENKAEVSLIAQRLINNITEPIKLPTSDLINVGVSIGISSFPKFKTIDELFLTADKAMYYVKAQGKNNYIYFGELMDKIFI